MNAVSRTREARRPPGRDPIARQGPPAAERRGAIDGDRALSDHRHGRRRRQRGDRRTSGPRTSGRAEPEASRVIGTGVESVYGGTAARSTTRGWRVRRDGAARSDAPRTAEAGSGTAGSARSALAHRSRIEAPDARPGAPYAVLERNGGTAMHRERGFLTSPDEVETIYETLIEILELTGRPCACLPRRGQSCRPCTTLQVILRAGRNACPVVPFRVRSAQGVGRSITVIW